VRSALKNIDAAEREGGLVKVREHSRKGRVAWKIEISEGKQVFVKADELARGGKWFHRFSPLHPFLREAKLLVRLGKAGLTVPRPVSVAYDPGRFSSRRVFLVTEALDGYEPLGVTIARSATEQADIPAEPIEDYPPTLARFLAGLHKIGFYHRDLQGDHILWRTESGEIKWAMVDLEGALIKLPLPTWYRIKSLYMMGRHLLAGLPPEASIEFISDYYRLSSGSGDPRSLIKAALKYAAFRQEGRAFDARPDKTIADYLRFALRHWRIPFSRLWFSIKQEV